MKPLARLLARATAFARTERGVVVLALGAIGLHVVDDNYLQPAPGTSPLDHLTSGLVPVAVLAGLAALYPRLRAGVRAASAMTFGAIGVALGAPGVYYLLDGSASGDHYTGLLAILAGLALFVSGPVTLWKARRTGGSRRRRYLRRSLVTGVGAVTAVAALVFLVFPVGFTYGYTHMGRTSPASPIGLPHETVTVTTSDGIELTALYVPSRNRAAVVVFPGGSAVKEARMLARNGYGVLLLDPRGQGGSEGDLVRWAGDRDLIAGAEYLQSRPDVDPDRIGGFGSSVAERSCSWPPPSRPPSRPSVSEGAGFPLGEATSKAGRACSSRRSEASWRPRTACSRTTPAGEDRRPHRPDRPARRLPRSTPTPAWAARTSGSRSTTRPPASRSRCGRSQAQSTPAASMPIRPSTSGA